MIICIQDLLFSLNLNCLNVHKWAGLRRSVQLSLRSNDSYAFINSLTFVVGDNIFLMLQRGNQRITHGSIWLVSMPPPRAHTREFAIFPLPRAHRKRQFPTPKLLIDLIYVFWNIFFLTIGQRDVVEFTERRIMDIEKEEELNS